jgi:hypothetical protein
MLERVRADGLLAPGHPALVLLSGGRDSTCLLDLAVRIAGPGALKPSIQLIQAPIFHGHAFSIYVEMEAPSSLDALSQSLAGEHITVARQAEDSPSNVNAAGQGDILVSLNRDENNPNGVWMWAAADNLRIAAVTAVEQITTAIRRVRIATCGVMTFRSLPHGALSICCTDVVGTALLPTRRSSSCFASTRSRLYLCCVLSHVRPVRHRRGCRATPGRISRPR